MQSRRFDILYLIRSGLAIPDYWHPCLRIQTNLQPGKIGRYPLSMDIKADYPGQLNAEGVPVLFLNTVSSCLPVTVTLFGLGSHDALLNTRESRYERQMVHALHWLKNHCAPLGDGIGWPHPEDLPVYGLTSPWFSGLANGFALSLFVRASRFDSSGGWRSMAYETWRGYHVPVEAGGFRRRLPEGVVYEEYPASELNFVFNGMCFALIGLWEAWQSGLIPDAEDDFHQGVQALRASLPLFIKGVWSLYSLTPRAGKPLLASPYYQRTNALLAQVLGTITDDPQFLLCSAQWLKSGESFMRRTAMSLRIAADRYLNARALLQRNWARI
jgi:hypothetical protein